MELWKYIPGFNNKYAISTKGTIRSLVYFRNLRYKVDNGYCRITLVNEEKVRKTYAIHLLVAYAFIPNPLGYNIVNHKDGNKRNNSVDNLEWCTQSENIKHAWDTGLIRKKRNDKYYDTDEIPI